MTVFNIWFDFAQKDYSAAKQLWPDHREIVCFHVQQVWEKCLKAILIKQQLGLHKTHDIRFLAKKISEFPKKWDEHLDTLSRMYILSRYPSTNTDIEQEYSTQQIQELLNTTQEVLKWTKKQLENA